MLRSPLLPTRTTHPNVKRDANHGIAACQCFDLGVRKLPWIIDEGSKVEMTRPDRTIKDIECIP